MNTTMRTIRSGQTVQIGEEIRVTARLGDRRDEIVLRIEETPRFPVCVVKPEQQKPQGAES